jgi:branched-subunit amino acid aminotransferase/4-amino-4-deoxychorismate lyase
LQARLSRKRLAYIATLLDNAWMNEPQAYLNGRFIPQSALWISATDAGFVQGTTVAEQLRTFRGKLFCLDDHLTRLDHSLETIGLGKGINRSEVSAAAQRLVEQNHRLLEADDDLGLSIFVTPGEYASYGAGGPTAPTLGMHTYPLPFRLWAAKYRTGQSLVTTEIEQVPPTCWSPSLKCRSRMHYYLADRRAAQIEPGARALLLDHDGFVTEASTANVILYSRDGLIAPPGQSVLRGISLAKVCQLAGEMGLLTTERAIRADDVARADEVFLASTPLCMLPVTRFNGRPIGDGAPGPVFQRLIAAWGEQVGLDVVEQAERFAARRGESQPDNAPEPV